MGSSPFARTLLRDRGVFSPVSFFCRLREEFWKTLRASRPRTPLSLRDISRGRTETSVAVSVARTFFRDRVFPGLFFLRPREVFGETLRVSRFRTPLSLRDISRGRMETSVAVSVARTLLRDRGVFFGLFFCACGRSSGQSLRASRFRTPLSLRDISRGRTETSVAVSVARTLFRGQECSPVSFKPSCGVISGKLSGRTPHSTDKLCVLLTLSGLKRFLTYKLLIVIVMSVNNRFNPDIITHINFSREHPYRVSVLCFQVRNHP